MDRISIIGGERLTGTIPISGAKNAALPLMIASLLTRETLTLKNVPSLADVNLLGAHSRQSWRRPHRRRQAGGPAYARRPNLPPHRRATSSTPWRPMRWSGACGRASGCSAPLLARCGEAKVSLPGGCAIGIRPVDLHLTALEALGAKIEIEGGYVIASAPNGLTRRPDPLSKVSVGATHNALMAAVLARGETLIENAAREPEVMDLAPCLVEMGAKIEGIGTSTLRVQGVDELHGAEHTVLPDRIETGTYAMAVAMTGGEVFLDGARADLLQSGARPAALERGRDRGNADRHQDGEERQAGSARSPLTPSPSRASPPTSRRNSWR